MSNHFYQKNAGLRRLHRPEFAAGSGNRSSATRPFPGTALGTADSSGQMRLVLAGIAVQHLEMLRQLARTSELRGVNQAFIAWSELINVRRAHIDRHRTGDQR